MEAQVIGLNKKLTNENFINRAPKEVVEKEQKKKADFVEGLEKLQNSLSHLTETGV